MKSSDEDERKISEYILNWYKKRIENKEAFTNAKDLENRIYTDKRNHFTADYRRTNIESKITNESQMEFNSKQEMEQYITEQADIRFNHMLVEKMTLTEKVVYNKILNEEVNVKDVMKRLTPVVISALLSCPALSAQAKEEVKNAQKELNARIEQSAQQKEDTQTKSDKSTTAVINPADLQQRCNFAYGKEHPMVVYGDNEQEAKEEAIKIIKKEIAKQHKLSEDELVLGNCKILVMKKIRLQHKNWTKNFEYTLDIRGYFVITK